MPKWKFDNVKQIYETTSINIVNSYLKFGWVLIDTYKTLHGSSNQQGIHYVLAWTKQDRPFHLQETITKKSPEKDFDKMQFALLFSSHENKFKY